MNNRKKTSKKKEKPQPSIMDDEKIERLQNIRQNREDRESKEHIWMDYYAMMQD